MAIELKKYNPNPEANSIAWGTEINPNSFYRVLGQEGASAESIYKDVLRTGQIRGSAVFNGDAYLAKGAPQGMYLHSSSQVPELLKHWSKEQVGNNNFFIEATNKFNPIENPLYSTINRLNINGNVSKFPKLGQEVPMGHYVTLAPVDNPSFVDRINPNNQKNLRMGQAYTSTWGGVNKGFSEGAPKWDWRFDYTKPFSETSLSQHGKNIVHIAKTIAEQPETKTVAKYASTTGKVGLGVAGLAGYTASFLEDAPKTVLAYGVPFTPLKIGLGPVLDLGKGSDLESRGQWVFSDTGEPRFVRYE